MAATLNTSGSSSCLKRIASSDDDASICCKHFRLILEPPSDSCSSYGVESIYSWQDRETASARDTSDTDPDTDDHEFEVRSESEVALSEVSSGPDNVVIIGNFDAIVDEFGSEISYIADLSDTLSDNEYNLRRLPQRLCEKCKVPCDEPFTLCLKCFKQRRTFQPPRPKKKGRRRNNRSSPGRADSGLRSQVSQESQRNLEGSQGGESDDSLCRNRPENSQQEGSTEAKVCKCCFLNPINGAFIHKNSVHSLYCYTCSVKQWQRRGRCPFCNQKLCKVAKIFPV